MEDEANAKGEDAIKHKDRKAVAMGKGLVTVSLMVMRDLRKDGETLPLGRANTALAVTEFSVPTQYLTPTEVARIIGLRAAHYLEYSEDIIDTVSEATDASAGEEAGEAAATQRTPDTDLQA